MSALVQDSLTVLPTSIGLLVQSISALTPVPFHSFSTYAESLSLRLLVLAVC